MKRIPLTGQVLESARRSYGPDADLSKLVVFEATVATTGRMRKKGLYAGGRMSENALSELTAAINTESVPMYMNHSEPESPYGRVFAASRDAAGGVAALFGLFEDQHPELILKLDSGTLDQVSVGLLPKRLACSECGFDYMGPDATWEHVMSATCSNGHTVGIDGAHVIVDSIDTVYEVSGVNKAGYSGARVRGPSDSVFAGTALAAGADGITSPFGLFLEADGDDPPPPVDDPPPVVDDEPPPVDDPPPAPEGDQQMSMDLTAALGEAVAKAVLTATGSVQTELAETRLKLTNQLAAATATNAQLQASLTAAEAATAEAKAQLDKIRPALANLASRTQVALSGSSTVKDTDSLDLLLSIIQDGNNRLSVVLPTGQRSGSTAGFHLNANAGRNNAAFVQG